MRSSRAHSVIVIVAALPILEHRAEVIAAFEAAIVRVHDEPGVELYALHEAPNRLVMIEKVRVRTSPIRALQSGSPRHLRSALDGKLINGLDVQVRVPHPAGDVQEGTL